MNKTIFSLAVLFSLKAMAQNEVTEKPSSDLERFFKIELFLDKLSVGYELPLGKKTLLDISSGLSNKKVFEEDYTTGSIITNDKLTLGLFFRGELRYYLGSREKRFNKGYKIASNAGNFIAFQSEYNSNSFKEDIPQVIMNEIHFGAQLPFDNHFYFRYHLGFGHIFGITESNIKLAKVYPSIGLFFGYTF